MMEESEGFPESTVEIGAQVFYDTSRPDAGTGWKFGRTPLYAIPSNTDSDRWYIKTEEGTVDAVYPDRAFSLRSFIGHLDRLDRQEVEVVDVDQSSRREKGIE